MNRSVLYGKPTLPGLLNLPTELQANLTAWWKMDEASGNRINSINPGVHDLTQNGTTIAVAGKIGSGNRPNGAGQNGLYCPSTSAFSFTQSVSFSAWVNPDVNNGAYLFSNWASVSGGSYAVILLLDNGTFTFVANNGLTINASTTVSGLNSGVWNHVAFTWDTAITTLTLYINNVVGATLNTGIVPNNTFESAVYIGQCFNNIASSTDEGAFWSNRVLTAANIATLNNSGNGLTT